MNDLDDDLETMRDLAVALKGAAPASTSSCVDPERMIALAERRVPEKEATRLLAHVALCARCRPEYAQTVALVEAARVSPPTPRPSRFPPLRSWLASGLGFTLGAAAAGLAAFALVVTPARQRSAQLAGELQRRTQAADKLAQDLAVARRRGDEAARLLNRRVAAQRVQIARLGESERLLAQLPLPVAQWTRPDPTASVRGDGTPVIPAPTLNLRTPIATAVATRRPILEVESAPGVTDYQATIERDGAVEAIPPLNRLGTTRWQLSAPLTPGAIYRWEATARRGDEPLRSAFVAFYVLSDAEIREWEEAQRREAKNPLALAIVAARLGLNAEIDRQLQRALKADPNHPVARRWLQERRTGSR